MSHIDTLKVYEDLISAGTPPNQAKAEVRAIDSSFDTVVTESYLTKEISLLKSEIRSDIAFLVILPIFFGFIAQIVLKKRGWL